MYENITVIFCPAAYGIDYPKTCVYENRLGLDNHKMLGIDYLRTRVYENWAGHGYTPFEDVWTTAEQECMKTDDGVRVWNDVV